MKIPFLSAAPRRVPTRPKATPKTQVSERSHAADRVTFTGRLGRIAGKACLGAVIGAAATGLGVATAMAGAPLLGVVGATALGIGLAHGLKMVVPSSFVAPSQAPSERTFYGGMAGFMGGAFGAAVTGLGLLTGGPAVAAAGIAIGYGSTLAAVRNTILETGAQFPNSL